jgi:hypothetical protein
LEGATASKVIISRPKEEVKMHFDHPCSFGNMTRHALTRCKQRGIRTGVVDLVLAQYDLEHHAGAGATAVSISRRRLAKLRADGVPASVIDQADHTILIIADDGAIVTAINRPTWFARFHYGADRLGHRCRPRCSARRVRRFR